MKGLLPWMGVAGFLLNVNQAHAGRVRTIYTNDRMMPQVFLALGRSTILRFDEKPRSAVIGNQNYFGLEYIGNDITLQPRGTTTTNLFVYTEYQTYGLILKVGGAGSEQYDDLVQVRWKPSYVNVDPHPKKRIVLVNELGLHRQMELKGLLRIKLIKVIHSVAQGVSILEFEAENLTKERIPASDLSLTIVPPDKSAPFQRLVMEPDVLDAGATGRGRVVARLEKLEGSDITASLRGNSVKFTVPKRGLK